MRVRRPARLRHHAQLNDLLIGRGSFLTFGRSFSGHGTTAKTLGLTIQATLLAHRRRGDRITMPMSAFGTKRTSQCAQPMSALRGKADIGRGRLDVPVSDPKRTLARPGFYFRGSARSSVAALPGLAGALSTAAQASGKSLSFRPADEPPNSGIFIRRIESVNQ